MAGLCEILAIAYLGEVEYIRLFKDFYMEFICKREQLYKDWYKIPQINRIRIYKEMELLSNNLEWLNPPDFDDIEFVN